MKLQVNKLGFSYEKTPILKNISFETNSGEITCLLGPNGTGKTTLLKCISRLITPSLGNVFVDGVLINKMKTKEISKLFSYVPQSTHSTFPISVIDIVLMGRVQSINFKVKEEDKQIVFNILEEMNLNNIAFKNINSLSGGERQRVFIAKAIAQQSPIILLDEPTSSLDMKNQLETLDIISSLAKEKNIMAIMSIHDLNIASMYADKIIMLKNCGVYASGNTEEVINEENIKQVYGVKAKVENRDEIRYTFLCKQ
ncbi:ABC transporter ATP-binding protein [Clostridium lundense]|uniref:ABC transporter ATP-binding protein n=1 Tax=Clostridium lundense TaxID=319475 RepID=UPI000481FEEF|nr:ABC transporter ATP-binding protein [Clostridium lundense]